MNRQQLNITVRSDVILNVTLVHEEEVLVPGLIDNLHANLITGLGKRTALATELGADYVIVRIPWEEGRLPGCYSLEIKGSINGLAWSAIGKSIIRYTSGTEAGADTVTVAADVYDVTMEAGYYYTDSPIAKVEATVDGTTGTPNVDVTYARKVLGLDFHGLKGETGGQGPEGRQGPAGQSAVFDPSTGNIATMEQTTGNSLVNTMSQKAITDELTSLVLSRNLSQLTALSNQWWISSALKWRHTTDNEKGKRYNVTQYRGLEIGITPQSGVTCQVGFLSAWADSDDDGKSVTTWCSGETLREISSATTIVIPNDAVYLYMKYLTGGSNVLPESIEIRSKLADSIPPLSDEVANLSAEMDAVIDSGILDIAQKVYVEASIATTKTSGTNTYNIKTSTGKYESPGQNGARYIDISQYKGKMLRVTPQEGKHAYFAFIDTVPVSGATVSYAGDTGYNDITAPLTLQVPDIEGTVYLWYNFNKSTANNNVCPESADIVTTFADEMQNEIGRPSVVYVHETNGSDENPGTSAKPVASIARAMDIGADVLRIIQLNSTTQPVDFSRWDGMKAHVTLCGNKGTRGIILTGKKLEGLVAVAGYDDVYEWTPGVGESLPSGDYKWLWQHNLADSSTAIPAEEIHPLQRRRGNRRLSTCLKHSVSLQALLDAVSPRWYVDSGKLYVRVVAGSDVETNPVYVPSGSYAIKAPTTYGLTLVNIETWYGNIVVAGGHHFEAYDSASRYTTGDGAWEVDGCLSAHLERCEADSNTMAATTKGDGFNMHPESSSSKLTRTGTHTLVNCWSHDNRDDGYSDHGWSYNNDAVIGGADGSIVGGLYEYNNQGGLTPSTGAHDTIIGAVSRYNTGRGILYTGDIGQGDVHCIGCVCYGNSVNFECKSGAAGAGDNNNVMVLEHCVSRNASEAGYIVGKNSTIHLHDCLDRGSAVVKKTENGGVFVVENGTLVS